jgi:hypothetical protein
MKNTGAPTASARRFFYDGSDRWSIEAVAADPTQRPSALRRADPNMMRELDSIHAFQLLGEYS